MTLQQLRYLSAIAQNGLNITAAAERLRTSQPAISKQIKLLERELGFKIFVRTGRTLSTITRPGQQVVNHALRILREAQNVKSISDEIKLRARDVLSIGTTHTQARYVLPPVIEQFVARHPKLQLHLHQGTSEQLAEMARLNRLDIAIATGSQELFSQFTLLPCYRWHRQLIVPRDHPLTRIERPTLAQIADYPIVTYVFSFSGPGSLHELFGAAGLRANVALTAQNADVIKTYVRLGLGVGIVASMAYDAVEDADLALIDASHLLGSHTTWLGFPRGAFLRRHLHDFVHLLAPHLTRTLVERAAEFESASQVEALLEHLELPLR